MAGILRGHVSGGDGAVANRLPTKLRSESRYLTVITAAFVLSRVLAFLAGVRYDSSPYQTFVQFIDPELLKHRLFESLWYLHAQPPLFNLYTGILLKLFPDHLALASDAVYLVLGLSLAISMFLVMVRLGVRKPLATLLTVLFTVSPDCLLYENWMLYTYPVAALLCLSVLALHRSLANWTFGRGLFFFSLLAAIVLTRSVFHLVWFLFAVVMLSLLRRHRWRSVAFACLLPLACVLLLYGKNLCLFGCFSSSSWLGMNLSKVITQRIPRETRLSLVQQGEISELALVRAFGGRVPNSSQWSKAPKTEIPVLDQEYKSVGGINYNHIAVVAISRQYESDALHLLRLFPGTYVETVAEAFGVFLRPASNNRFLQANRVQIGPWVKMFDSWLYGEWAVADRADGGGDGNADAPQPRSSGVAVLLIFGYPFLTVFALLTMARAFRNKPANLPLAGTLLFMCTTALYVTAVVNSAEIGENNRSRFMIDPLLVVFLGLFANWCLARLSFGFRSTRSATRRCNLGNRRPARLRAAGPQEQP